MFSPRFVGGGQAEAVCPYTIPKRRVKRKSGCVQRPRPYPARESRNDGDEHTHLCILVMEWNLFELNLSNVG